MAAKLKPLKDQVIVITGASSGIGLETARRAAEGGARVVLVARNEAALEKVTEEINETGGQAIYVAADVADREALQRVADVTIERFGGFDTWVNDAGLGIVGRLEDVAEEDSRRMFDTNFWGLVNGSLIAAAHLKAKGGAIINLGSVASDVAFPLQGMYSASKHAVKGFTDALRIELEEADAPICVTLIKPAGIDTPFMQHARNYTDKEPKLPPPVYEPKEVAIAILHAATHWKRDVYVGGGGKMMSTLNKHSPRLMDKMNERVVIRQMHRDEPPRNPDGALHHFGRDGHVRGDQPGLVRGTSLVTRASLHPVLTGFALVAGVAAAAYFGAEKVRKH
ncbi:MAG: SDR family oxidoreductase [Fimbriimonas sp.]